MRISCPYCHSVARLTPNPAHNERNSLPVYLLKCSGCNRTGVGDEGEDNLAAAVFGH
jgi:hypothetical protein